jgi:hypothetical protein
MRILNLQQTQEDGFRKFSDPCRLVTVYKGGNWKGKATVMVPEYWWTGMH